MMSSSTLTTPQVQNGQEDEHPLHEQNPAPEGSEAPTQGRASARKRAISTPAVTVGLTPSRENFLVVVPFRAKDEQDREYTLVRHTFDDAAAATRFGLHAALHFKLQLLNYLIRGDHRYPSDPRAAAKIAALPVSPGTGSKAQGKVRHPIIRKSRDIGDLADPANTSTSQAAA